MIFTNPFRQNNGMNYKGYKTIILDTPTNDGLEIVSRCITALRSIYRPDCIYKRAGVIVSDIVTQSQVQLTFFDKSADMEKRQNLMTAMDKLNDMLDKTLKDEDYELAAKIRDEINRRN